MYQTFTFGLKAIQPELIHVEETPGNLAALQVVLACRRWAPGRRLVWQAGSAAAPATSWTRRKLAAMALRWAAAVIHPWEFRAGQPAGWTFDGISAVIPFQGVDLHHFRPMLPSRLNRPFTVGYFGELVAARGVDLLVDAVGRLAGPVRLRMAGEGPERPAVERKAAEAGWAERLEFVATPSPDDLPEEYSEVDVVVLPSRPAVGRIEMDARCLIRAMACKKPVIGADWGAIPEIIGNAGFTFPVGDVQALADCMQQVQDSPMLRQYMAERGYTRVSRRFSRERVAELTAGLYRRLLNLPDPQPHESDS
jgi:glycosyltransferase involved in cell wall biosynthesis